MKRPANIYDVARLARVSIKTVSRVVNQARVSDKTRAVVERAIEALGYRPNLVARSLRTSRSFLIAAISPYLDSFYWQALHSSTIQACRQNGFHLMIELVSPNNAEALQSLETSLKNLHFAGAVLNPLITEDQSVMNLLERLKLRYVRIFPMGNPDRADAVFADENKGLQLLAAHFWNLGHRKIAIAAGPPGIQGADRAEQLRRALLALGAAKQMISILPLNWHGGGIEAGRQLAASVLALRERPSAMFAHTDGVAAGAIGYFIEHGLQVPRDLSVAGFDDSEIAQAIWPPLTTIKLPIDQMAHAAISLLLNPDPKIRVRRLTCPVEFIVRGSTGPAPRGKPT